MFNKSSFFSLACLVAALGGVNAGVLLTLANVRLTVYYDNTIGPNVAGVCGTTHGWGDAWQNAVLNDPGSCGGKTYAASGNNRMVALPGSLNPKLYCGKKVKITDSTGKVLSVDGKDYFYVKDTLPGEGLDISAKAMTDWSGGVCGIEPTPGAINMPTGFTVQVLDEADPEGAPLNDFVESNPVPVANPTASVAAVATVSAGTGGGDCPCTAEGQKGCCNGVGAICGYISNVPKILGFKPIPGTPCRAKRDKFYA